VEGDHKLRDKTWAGITSPSPQGGKDIFMGMIMVAGVFRNYEHLKRQKSWHR
jgi:hypothetical protein